LELLLQSSGQLRFVNLGWCFVIGHRFVVDALGKRTKETEPFLDLHGDMNNEPKKNNE
jgi:hypothetical protein